MESNDLALTLSNSARELTPQIWEMIERMSPVMYRSRLFGVSSQEAAAAIMLKGYELGLSITASFEFINVIQGKPSLSPRGALALLLTHPEIERVEIKRLPGPTGAYIGHECYMKRKNGFEYRAHFTIEDAKRAGLVKAGGAWESYPENLAMWRAVGFCADVVAPDITAGMTALMKMPEQFGVALSQDGEIGEIIEAAPLVVTEQAPSTPVPGLTLENLLDLGYSAEQILVANEGRLPGTDEELNAVALKLAGVQ